MRRPTFRTPRRLAFLALASLLACRDGGAGPEPGPQATLAPGAAVPLTLVSVQGLSEAHAPGGRAQVFVGGLPVALLLDPVDQVHRFMVPDLPAGPAQVVIPARPGAREVRLDLAVLPRQYAGGSPDAALREMDTLLDSVRVSLALGMGAFDSHADSIVVQRIHAVFAFTEALQRHVPTLPAADRALAAALFSGMAADLRTLAGSLAAMSTELADQPPVLVNPQASPSVLSATALVTRCEAYSHRLDMLKDVVEVVGHVAMVAEALSWVGGPQARVFVGIITGLTTAMLDAMMFIVNAVPHLIDPEGFRIQATRRVKDDGGDGVMTVWVRRRAAGELLENGLGAVSGMGDVVSAIRNYGQARSRMDLLQMQAELVHLQDLQEALQAIDRAVSDFWNDHVIQPGEVQVTFDGVVWEQGPGARWEFTDAPTVADRGFRTRGKNTEPVETVTLAARIGTSNRCKASTLGSDPAQGRNGFQITTPARVRFTPPSTHVEVRPGQNAFPTLAVRNTGGDSATVLTYRLQHSSGVAYRPPRGVVLGLPQGPARLAGQAQGTVRLTVSPASEMREQQLAVPVVVLEGSTVVDQAIVNVTIGPQHEAVIVNRSPSVLQLWDHGDQDGDIVTLTLNGAPIVSGFTITNAGHTFPVSYRVGRNVLTVRTHNQGSIVPNTSSVGFANVVRGPPVHHFRLGTGVTRQVIITYDPNATATGPALSGQLPDRVYFPCAEGGGAGCTP